MEIGARCQVLPATESSTTQHRYGKIAYIGEVDGLSPGKWIGVQLDLPLGRNNGSFNNKQYFNSKDLHGVFVREERIELCNESNMNTSSTEVEKRPFSNIAIALEARRIEYQAKKQIEKERRHENQEYTMDELIQMFWEKFTASELDIRAKLSQYVDTLQQFQASKAISTVETGNNCPEDFDSLVERVHMELRDEAAKAANLYLSAYDIRQTQIIVTKILKLVEEMRTLYAPRKKFKFRARTKASENNKEPGSSSSISPIEIAKEPSSIPKAQNELVYDNRQNETIIIDTKSFQEIGTSRKDLNLSQLTHCVIVVTVETSAIRANALVNCTVITGGNYGSFWLEDCVNCQFHVVCRQLRVHQTSKSTFYVRIPSHPIIEDCHDLAFGPYRITFQGLKEQLESMDLLHETGYWCKVSDFKWHKAQQSPNWIALKPNALDIRIPESIQHVVSLDADILSAH